MAIGPAIPDTKNKIGFEKGRIAVTVTGLQTDHTCHQWMIVRNRAPAHERRDHRHTGQFRELNEFFSSVCNDDPATGDDERAFRFV